jgi:predicted RNase H-like nuclease (RuvC/YqgF family)
MRHIALLFMIALSGFVLGGRLADLSEQVRHLEARVQENDVQAQKLADRCERLQAEIEFVTNALK